MYVCLHTTYMPGALRVKKGESDPLNLGNRVLLVSLFRFFLPVSDGLCPFGTEVGGRRS